MKLTHKSETKLEGSDLVQGHYARPLPAAKSSLKNAPLVRDFGRNLIQSYRGIFDTIARGGLAAALIASPIGLLISQHVRIPSSITADYIANSIGFYYSVLVIVLCYNSRAVRLSKPPEAKIRRIPSRATVAATFAAASAMPIGILICAALYINGFSSMFNYMAVFLAALYVYSAVCLLPFITAQEDVSFEHAIQRLGRLLRGNWGTVTLYLFLSNLIWICGILFLVVPGIYLAEWHQRNIASIYKRLIDLETENPRLY